MNPDDQSKNGKRKAPPEVDAESGIDATGEDDLLLADSAVVHVLDDDDVENVEDADEMQTGKFEMPEHFRNHLQGEDQAEADEEDELLSEAAFEEVTGEAHLEQGKRSLDTRSYGESFDPKAADSAPGEASEDELLAEDDADLLAEDAFDGVSGEEEAIPSDPGHAGADEAAAEEQATHGEEAGLPDAEPEPVPKRSRSRRRRPKRPPDEFEDDDFDEIPSEAVITADGDEDLDDSDESLPEGAPWADDDASETGEDDYAVVASFPDRTPPEGVEVPPWSAPDTSTDAEVSPDGSTRVEQAFAHAEPAADEKTLILGEGAAAEPEYPFLVVVQGEEEGREIELVSDEMTLGRGADNDLVFPDIACSRRHALLERDGDDFVLSDLGSGNGTLLNGRRVQRARLQDGDEIEVGNTILQFCYPGAVAQEVGRSVDTVTSGQVMTTSAKTGFLADPRHRKLVLFGGGGVVGFLLILVLVKAIAGPAQPEGPTPEERRRQEESRVRDEFNGHFDAAKQLVKAKKWEEASLKIQLALKVKPDDPTGREYRDFITREAAASRHLAAALNFAASRDWDKAVDSLNNITEDSEYFEKAAAEKARIEKLIQGDLMEQGQALLKEQKYAQAVLKFDEVLRKDANNEEAAILKRKAEAELAKEEARVARLEREKARAKTHKRTRRKKRSEPSKRKGVTGQVLALYKNGEVDKAIEKAEGSGSSQQADQLKKFKGAYSRGMELSRNPGQADQAVKMLRQAVGLDKAISGGSGKYFEEISKRLGNVYFRKGVDAHTRQKFPQAYQAYQSALKYRPGFKLAEQRMQDLEKTAKKLYEEAYVIRSANPDRAIKNLDIVVQIIPASHPYYSKAKKMRIKLQGPVGGGQEPDDGF